MVVATSLNAKTTGCNPFLGAKKELLSPLPLLQKLVNLFLSR
jgi:hypothetical protein